MDAELMDREEQLDVLWALAAGFIALALAAPFLWLAVLLALQH